MPVESIHPPITVPAVDLWEFLFERNDRLFPDDHGQSQPTYGLVSNTIRLDFVLLFQKDRTDHEI